jgi:hypothetical protein
MPSQLCDIPTPGTASKVCLGERRRKRPSTTATLRINLPSSRQNSRQDAVRAGSQTLRQVRPHRNITQPRRNHEITNYGYRTTMRQDNGAQHSTAWEEAWTESMNANMLFLQGQAHLVPAREALDQAQHLPHQD